MAASTTPTKATKTPKPKKEKTPHPHSRKAGQIERSQLRKNKLSGAAAKRSKGHISQVDKYVFFYHALPPEQGCSTLEELHSLIKDVWLTRHDATLEEERAARRKGRPKSTLEMKLEEIKLAESEEYRTGMEVPDLTHPANVEVFRRWDQVELPFIQLLRFIRISSENPTSVVVSRPGKHGLITLNQSQAPAQDMDVVAEEKDMLFGDEAPPLRYSSTMMTMDC